MLFIGAAGGTTYYLYQKKQKPAIVFTTDSVVVNTIIKKTLATGTIEPRKEVLVKPQISGIIEKLFKKSGDLIKQGDIIAQIKIVPNMQRINDAETALKTAKINFELSEREYKRQEQLLKDKVISQFDYIKYEQDYKIRKEQLEAAENTLQLVIKGTSKRIEKPTTLVRATIGGKILDIPVKEGSMVIEANNFNEGTTIATIANMSDLIFKGKIIEAEVGKLKEGMPLVLEIGAISNTKFNAKLEFISSKGVDDKGAVKFEIKAGLSNLDVQNQIRAGYSASADIILDRKDSVIAIKEKNIEFSGDSAFVYLKIAEQDFKKTYIKLGLSDNTFVEVLSGLKKGDKIKEL